MTLHDTRFPGESDAYRLARDELLAAELELRRQVEAVAAQRRAMPLGGEVATDYAFAEWDATVGKVQQVRLSDLFAPGKDSLVLYSFMFKPGEAGLPLEVPCPLCTSIIDGVDGAVPHIEQQINFAVVTKAPVQDFSAHARGRGWRHARLLSSAGTSFNADYHVESGDDDQYAMVTSFVRRGGAIHHFWSSEVWFMPPEPGQNPRHVDFMWPLWAVLDRTQEGRGADWWPSFDYAV
jgi:predicted dithiol-disulfide oxidoreductase (DUF899 family)